MSTATCKHCNEQIKFWNDGYYTHVTGDQAGKFTCAISPYGFHAEPVGAPCGDHPANPCNGIRMEPDILIVDQTPLTSSEDRMHELDSGCWCSPTIDRSGPGYPIRVHHAPEGSGW